MLRLPSGSLTGKAYQPGQAFNIPFHYLSFLVDNYMSTNWTEISLFLFQETWFNSPWKINRFQLTECLRSFASLDAACYLQTNFFNMFWDLNWAKKSLFQPVIYYSPPHHWPKVILPARLERAHEWLKVAILV